MQANLQEGEVYNMLFMIFRGFWLTGEWEWFYLFFQIVAGIEPHHHLGLTFFSEEVVGGD